MVVRWLTALPLCTVVALLIAPVSASPGDGSIAYQECTSECRNRLECPSFFVDPGWTTSECFWCKYDCMWKTVDAFTSRGYSVPQFHGKWPFLSTFWAQEPASVMFSLANLLSVELMRRRMSGLIVKEGSDQEVMRRIWMGYAMVGIVTWVCSTWFHAADHFWSERADYFTAFAFVLYANYAAVMFVFPQMRSGWRGRGVSAAFLLLYVRHVSNMSHHFDYGWNMTLCIGCSVCTLFTYFFYLFQRWRRFGSFAALRQSDRLLLLVLAWTSAAVSMELHDFVPFFYTIDAHALFHAATVPLPIFTARFIEAHASESGLQYAKIV